MSFLDDNLFDPEQLKSPKRKEKSNSFQEYSFAELTREIESFKTDIQNLTQSFNRLEVTTKNQLNPQVEWYKHHWVVAILTSISVSLLWIALLKLTPLALYTLSEKDKSFHTIGKLKVQTAAREKTKKRSTKQVN